MDQGGRGPQGGQYSRSKHTPFLCVHSCSIRVSPYTLTHCNTPPPAALVSTNAHLCPAGAAGCLLAQRCAIATASFHPAPLPSPAFHRHHPPHTHTITMPMQQLCQHTCAQAQQQVAAWFSDAPAPLPAAPLLLRLNTTPLRAQHSTAQHNTV
jgi:hypothetical protein